MKLVKHCALKMAKLVLGEICEKKKIALSDTTVARRIEEMSRDIKDQVTSEIKGAQFGYLHFI